MSTTGKKNLQRECIYCFVYCAWMRCIFLQFKNEKTYLKFSEGSIIHCPLKIIVTEVVNKTLKYIAEEPRLKRSYCLNSFVSRPLYPDKFLPVITTLQPV